MRSQAHLTSAQVPPTVVPPPLINCMAALALCAALPMRWAILTLEVVCGRSLDAAAAPAGSLDNDGRKSAKPPSSSSLSFASLVLLSEIDVTTLELFLARVRARLVFLTDGCSDLTGELDSLALLTPLLRG